MLAAMPTATNPPSRDEPPIRVRGDACPGTLRLHAADDGALARVRIPGGVLTAGQADALAVAAERLGDGALHLTSRGNVQVRGLDGDCGGDLAALLDAAGLLPSYRHERVRNIVATPLSGLDGSGRTDVQPWLRELDRLLCASEAATGLSGRFLFALDDGRGDVSALGPDVTLVALAGGDALLFVWQAPAALRVTGAYAARAALTAAETFLEAAAASGTKAWRVSDLPGGGDAFGSDGFGSGGFGSAGSLLRETARRLEAAGVPVTHPVAAGLPSGPAPAPGTVHGPGGTAALSVVAPLGRLTVAQWRHLVAAAREDGSGELRLTPWRGAVLPGFGRARAADRLAGLAAAGLITDPASPWYGVGACIGRPGCAKSLADVRADAATALGAGGGRAVHWSGCERRCGHPQGEWVDVVATGDGYQVSLRGEGLRTVVDGAPHMNESSHVNGSPGRVAEPEDVAGADDLAVAVAAARTTTATTATR
ncbi:precorrin-3B synthase [Streptomyces sclerotialus]|uniref:precorrin-3B synthase n=1 Tax=Streptomyces sclerotialus TaxID=1957 RepID=UPI0004C7B5A9